MRRLNVTMLTDSRLHVCLRLCLEYKIPEISEIALSLLMGDKCKKQHLNARCEQCVKDLESPAPHKSDPSYAPCAAFIREARDYLKCLQKDWKAYLTQARTRVIRLTMSIKKECDSAEKDFRRTGDAIVFRRRIEQSQTALSESLHELNARHRPCRPRPPRVEENATNVRRFFDCSHPNLSKEDLLRAKEAMERSIAKMQHELASGFVAFIHEVTTENAN